MNKVTLSFFVGILFAASQTTYAQDEVTPTPDEVIVEGESVGDLLFLGMS